MSLEETRSRGGSDERTTDFLVSRTGMTLEDPHPRGCKVMEDR